MRRQPCAVFCLHSSCFAEHLLPLAAGTQLGICPSCFSSHCFFLPSFPHVSSALLSPLPSTLFFLFCVGLFLTCSYSLFSSLLPLGSVSGTVSLFFYLFTLPFPSLSLHSAHPLTHPVLSDPSSLSFCLLSSSLTHFSHQVKLGVLITFCF